MYRYYLLIFVYGLIISCNKEKNITELASLLTAPNADFRDSLDIILNIEVKIKADSNFTYLRPTIFSDTILLAYVKEKENIISIFNLKTKSHVRDFEISPLIQNRDKYSTFYIHNLDSIFMLTSNNTSIYLLNGNGGLIKSWSSFDLGITPPNTYIFPYFLPQHSIYFNSKTNLVYASLIPGYFPTSSNFEDVPQQVVFNLASNIIKLKYGPPEGVMKMKGDLVFPGDLSFPYSLTINEATYISYPLDHFVYIYNNETGILVEKKAVCSSEIKNFPFPLPSEMIKDTQAMWNFRVQTPFYEPLNYHSKVKLFTRAVHHPQELKEMSGKLNTGKRRRTSVIILDSTLQIIGETFFNDGIYQINGAVPLSDGLLLYSNKGFNNNHAIPSLKYEFVPKIN
ncbi:MAG: DUF4221 family protein [Flammeovirgaceae bacterium]|nr:DUF4221 family protein [Flammeovirgaceae bacterium]